MNVEETKEALFWAWRKRMREMECRTESIQLPPENRFGENWTWEDSEQCYELDHEFHSQYYFDDMDADDLCHLIRKMDNFLRERGISDHFIQNYGKCCHAFHKFDEKSSYEEYGKGY